MHKVMWEPLHCTMLRQTYSQGWLCLHDWSLAGRNAETTPITAKQVLSPPNPSNCNRLLPSDSMKRRATK